MRFLQELDETCGTNRGFSWGIATCTSKAQQLHCVLDYGDLSLTCTSNNSNSAREVKVEATLDKKTILTSHIQLVRKRARPASANLERPSYLSLAGQ